MADKKARSMKVYGQSGYKYRETPTITLKGLWLEAAGFRIGDYISVSCENGRLVITPDAERAKVAEAEKTFMERELKVLVTIQSHNFFVQNAIFYGSITNFM